MNHALNISNKSEVADLELMVYKLEHMHNSIGPSATMLWLRDYIKFFREVDPTRNQLWGFDLYGGDYENNNIAFATTLKPPERPLSYEHLEQFLDDKRYEHYKADIRWSVDEKR